MACLTSHFGTEQFYGAHLWKSTSVNECSYIPSLTVHNTHNSIGLITPDTQWQTFNTQRARLTTQHLSCHLVQSRSLSFICRFLSTFSQSLWLWGGLNDKKHTHKNSRVTQLESLFLWLTWAMCYLKDTWIMKHHWVFSSKGWSDATTVLSMKYWGGKKNRFTCHAGLH